MIVPLIAGIVFPYSMGVGGGGKITPHWQEQRISGSGIAFHVGEQWLEWDWEILELAEYDWLMARYAADPVTFQLWDDDTRRNLLTFTSGAMTEPRAGGTYGNVCYANVHVEFHALMPLRS
jgi:hypothetical protein